MALTNCEEWSKTDHGWNLGSEWRLSFRARGALLWPAHRKPSDWAVGGGTTPLGVVNKLNLAIRQWQAGFLQWPAYGNGGHRVTG